VNRKNKVVSAAVGLGVLFAYAAYAQTGSLSGSAVTPTPTSAVTVVSGSSAAATSAFAGSLASANSAALIETAPANGEFFSFGVQTHFSQNWPAAWLGLANQIGARTLRDTVSWASVEKQPGVYTFAGSTSVDTLTRHCAANGKLILTIVQKNALYDGGKTVYSAAGQTAYASYVKALLDRFGSCISAIEVGNEINGADALDYPAGMDEARTYVASLQELARVVKPAHPKVAILGGSTNTVGTGFLEKLFAAGALNVMDGVAVHPYRGSVEGLDLEITHLRDVMRKYGAPVDIWATEFSYDTSDQAAAAAGLVKSAAQLSASGVDHASWYALVDQTWFPNMGLFTKTAIKPNGMAYQTIMQRLFAYGRAVRVDTGDGLVYLYRFGANHWLAWGAPRTLTFFGAPVVRDIYGTARTGASVQLSGEPVIVEGASGFTMTASDVVADTMLQYGSAPWSYLRRGSNNKDVALPLFDNDFTSYFGDRWSKPLRINSTSAAPAGTGSDPMRAVIRYTSPKAQQLDLDVCLSKTVKGDGVDYKVTRNGVVASSGILTSKTTIRSLALDLAPGDKVDLIFGPNQTYGDDSFSYRARLTARGRGAAMCS
jgi:hypothetical protein